MTATSTINEIELTTEEFKIVKQRRIHSFRDVILNDVQREKFRKFLRTVFNAEPVHVIYNYVNRAVRNPTNENDHDIYRELQNALKTREFSFIRNLFALIKQILQLRAQIKDMLRQQISIFNKLGYCGKVITIRSYINIFLYNFRSKILSVLVMVIDVLMNYVKCYKSRMVMFLLSTNGNV